MCGNINTTVTVKVTVTVTATIAEFQSLCNCWRGMNRTGRMQAAQTISHTYLQIHGILDVDDILTREGLICQQILHESGLDVQLLHRLPRIHIARRAYRHDVCALCEHLHNAMVLEPCKQACQPAGPDYTRMPPSMNTSSQMECGKRLLSNPTSSMFLQKHLFYKSANHTSTVNPEMPGDSKTKILHWGDVVGNVKDRLSCPAIHIVSGMRICLQSIRAVCLIVTTSRAMKCMLTQT